MKKSILTLVFAVASIALFAQKPVKQDSVKKDTVIQLNMKLNDYRGLMYAIDANIDSKKASKEILEFLQKRAQIVQPADKPKK